MKNITTNVVMSFREFSKDQFTKKHNTFLFITLSISYGWSLIEI